MRIEVLEERLSDTDAETGRHYLLGKGDIVTVSDAYGARLCAFGWVKDADGVVETGERKPGAEILIPQKLLIKTGAKVNG